MSMSIDQAKELRSSSLWTAVCEEIDRKVFFNLQKLVTCKPEELFKLQASIAALEEVKKLPEDVIDRESGA